MEGYRVLDVGKAQFGGLETLFPGWSGKDEALCVYSPHDDDALLGAGYAMRWAMAAGARVYVIIVCSGDCGYSTVQEKDTIVQRRHAETVQAYGAFGIPEENLLFLNFPDFSALSDLGRQVSPAREGHFRQTITWLRRHRITRVLSPNPWHEHIDHTAAGLMAQYDAPQAGDMHSVDWADPFPVRSTAEYSVWAELGPEDALVAGRDPGLRANAVLIALAEAEQAVISSLTRYASQQAIIADLMAQRQARRLPEGSFIEVYRRYDARPKLDYEPYKRLLERLNNGK